MLAVLTLAAAPAAAQSFTDCVAGLRQQAIAAGLDRATAARALSLTQPDEKVLRFSQFSPEFDTPIWDYLAYLVDDQRIADGRAMMQRHAATLRAVEARYGIDRHVIAAVWGVESDYGRSAGDNFLPHALATLVCAGESRREFWRKELAAALSLVARGDLQLDELYGSWAGAFGHTQFIPTTYERHAVDFDGDGRRDLVKSIPDALASTANYLRRTGWRSGEPWMLEVKVRPNYAGPRGRRAFATLADWGKRGVTRADGTPLAGRAMAGLLLPAGPNGPGFLTFRNFGAIFAYNHADSYAIAISHLAHRLAGLPGFRTPWPTDDPGLSRVQQLELQKLLLAKGYDIGKPDGKIGPATRTAIAEAEKRLGWPATGRAGMKIYKSLGGK
jgi:lytic murein transglycosylase